MNENQMIREWGKACLTLKQKEEWKSMAQMEETILFQLAQETVTLNPAEVGYDRQMAHKCGVIEGIKKLRVLRENYIQMYKEASEEDSKEKS